MKIVVYSYKSTVKVKGTAFPVLAMRTYSRNRGTASLILNLGTDKNEWNYTSTSFVKSLWWIYKNIVT
jgi:hypothetical protein